MTDFDVAICGAGPIGLALALLAVKRGTPARRIALIDAKSVAQACADPRSIALSYGSRQILEDIGAWPVASTAIHQIHVSRRGHFGRTLIERDEFDLPALGYVTRYGALVKTLAACAEETGLSSFREMRVNGVDEDADAVTLELADGRHLRSAFAVQAEGGLFSDQSEKATRHDYRQTAVVAQVWSATPQTHRAYERFTEEGPLALLPQDDGYALVWCVRPEHAASLLQMDDAAFLAALQGAFGMRVGKFLRVTPRSSFPLGLNAQAARTVRTIAIGNAAQTLHPVAGQGLNLGLRDASVLAQTLAQDAGADALERYATLRQSDRSATIRLTDIMARIFASAPDGSPSQALLGVTLGIVDSFDPLKRALAEQMMFGRR